MAYTRQPNVVLAGKGLKQSPTSGTVVPPGVVPVTLDADIATTSSLGMIQVGSGLSITPAGILSAGGSSFINVFLVSEDYIATIDDYYIGATKNNITITLPVGLVGKVLIVKNQVNGNIKVQGSDGELIDSSATKILGSEASLMTVFDGFRWNLI